MAYLPPGGGQSGSDNTDELKEQTELLESIDDELEDQGKTLDSINSGIGTGNSTLTQIKGDTANLSGIKSDTSSIDANLDAIEAELIDQGTAQDSELLIARKTWILLEEVIRQLKILNEYNILITDEEITEKDLREVN